MFLDGKLKHVQTVLGADVGYGETRITCMHTAESTGKVSAWVQRSCTTTSCFGPCVFVCIQCISHQNTSYILYWSCYMHEAAVFFSYTHNCSLFLH